MVEVRVASARFTSMLANRGMSTEQFSEGLSAEVDLAALIVSDQDLPFEHVVALASRFKKTWPYLLIDEPERRTRHGSDNRTVANRAVPLSATLLDQLARVEAMLDWSAELFPEVIARVPDQPIGTGTTARDASGWIRSLLGVTADAQIAAAGPYGSLRLWSEALQACGVFVQMRRLEDPTVRAFSVIAGDQAVVVADTHDIPYARVFSLLHEYVHIILRSAGICDLDDQVAVERYCNEVAAQVLMPVDLMRRELGRAPWGLTTEDDEERVASISARLGVSKATFLIRLHEMGVLSDDEHAELERRRLARPGKPDSKGGNYHRNAINKVGRRFAQRVVGAYEAGAIDRRDASTMLEIPEHNFPGLRTELGKAG